MHLVYIIKTNTLFIIQWIRKINICYIIYYSMD